MFSVKMVQFINSLMNFNEISTRNSYNAELQNERLAEAKGLSVLQLQASE
jgi:hypothetical protein